MIVNHQIVWLLPRMSYSNAFHVMEIFADHQETELRQSIQKEAVSIVLKRWMEISNPGVCNFQAMLLLNKIFQKGLPVW